MYGKIQIKMVSRIQLKRYFRRNSYIENENGEVLQTTKTDKDGKYQFTGLENGTYKVEFETPSGYTPTQVGSGTDEGIDSNGTSTTGVIKDKDNDTIDSGFYKPTYNLGDYVWEDTNKNGVQDKDEKGISGVTVTLKDENDKVLKQLQQMKMVNINSLI